MARGFCPPLFGAISWAARPRRCRYVAMSTDAIMALTRGDGTEWIGALLIQLSPFRLVFGQMTIGGEFILELLLHTGYNISFSIDITKLSVHFRSLQGT